jgi:hypothetical protein
MEPTAHRPDYPPKTPPPQPKPISPERPNPPTKPVKDQLSMRRPAMVIRNRRVANWGFENAPWSPPKAAARVVEQLVDWGYPVAGGQRDTVTAVTRELALAALADGGRRVTVHVADQDRQALVMVLSHQEGPAPGADPELLGRLSALGVVSCGTETERDEPGNRRWALLDLAG